MRVPANLIAARPALRAAPTPAAGSFSGEPETRWLIEADIEDRRMRLLASFSLADPKGRLREVPAGYDKMEGIRQ